MTVFTIYIVIMGVWVFCAMTKTFLFIDKLTNFVNDTMDFKGSLTTLEAQIRNNLFSGKSDPQIHKIKFKYYSKLITLIFEQKAKIGIDPDPPLKEILNAIVNEKKQIQLIKSELQSSLLQFFLITLVTWVFSFFVDHLVGLRIELSQLIFIMLIQLFGLISFLIFFYIIYHFKFIHYESLFELFYSSRIFWSVNLPINLIGKLKLEINPIKNKKSHIHLKKYEQLMELGQRYGTVGHKDFNQIIQGLWDALALDFDDFVKKLSALKFIHVTLIYVPSYFLLLYFLLNRFGF